MTTFAHPTDHGPATATGFQFIRDAFAIRPLDQSIFNPDVWDAIARERRAAELTATDPFNRFAPVNTEAVPIRGVTVEGERLAPPSPEASGGRALGVVGVLAAVLVVLLGVELLLKG